MIEWEGGNVVDRETNMCARWIKEAIWIRKTVPTMNRDEGLNHVCDSLLAMPSSEQWKFSFCIVKDAIGGSNVDVCNSYKQ